MTAEDKMSKAERRQYLQRMQKRYKKAKRTEKTAMSDEMLIHTGMWRESLKRSMRSNLEPRPRSRQRGPKYKAEFDRELAKIWEATDYVCPERLTPNLVELAEKLASHQELRLTPTLKQQLEQVSVATVHRHLPRIPLAHRHRQPRPALNQHQQNIPTRIIPRNTALPGHFEVDLVYHCGDNLNGEFAFTLQLVDVATGWSGRRAILGRSYLVMEDALISLMTRIPFPIRELHPDNGSEFLNAHLLTFLKTRYPEIALSRSRPAHPNDNRLVEQKNHTLVRQYLGQRRFDTVTQTRFLNTIYDQLSDLYNYIQPAVAAFNIAILMRRPPVGGAGLHPVVVEELQIPLSIGARAAHGLCCGAGMIRGGTAIVCLVIGWHGAQLLQRALHAQTYRIQRLGLGYDLPAAYVRADSRLFLSPSFLSFAHHDPHLSVGCSHSWASWALVYADCSPFRVGISNCH